MELPVSDSPQYIHLVTWGFYGMISLIGWIGLRLLSKLSDSVGELNKKVAVVIERVDSHEKRLDKHDVMIDGFEKKR